MQKLFLIVLGVLLAWSSVVYLLQPENRTDKPVLYWVTDNNPARQLQVKRFHQWLKENGYPEMELRLDTSNAELSKRIIQGVSGVGSDIIDSTPQDMRLFVRMGILRPLTEQARAMGFSPEATYPALRDLLMVDGEQYIFPCNVTMQSLVLNRETFHRVGMTPPPERWTFEEFESYGREYVRRANAGLSRQVNFLSSTAVYMPSTSTENSFIASAHVGLRLGKALFK